MVSTNGTLHAALDYLGAGLCVLPARLDPKMPALSTWKPYQERLPREEEVRKWLASDLPLCLLTGTVSGHLEMIDFDQQGELFAAWVEIVEQEIPGLFDRLVIEQSQSGGFHVVYRSAVPVCGNKKLAVREVVTPDGQEVVIKGKAFKPRKRADDSWAAYVTLIETRGEGGLFVCAPSPGYKLVQGSFEQLPVLTEEEREVLLEAAWSLNEHFPPVEPPAAPRAIPLANGDGMAGRPGDEFNRRGDVREVLERHGWQLARPGENEYWRRPGKGVGWSATLKNGVFYVFSSNASPFEPDRGYSPFATYALLEHGGDFARAASALRDAGYGSLAGGDGVDLSRLTVRSARDSPSDAPRPSPRRDPGPFPEHLLRVPGLIDEVMAYNLATARRPQPVLALAGAICLQSVLAARKVRDESGNRTNLYVVGVSPSGSGKEYARKVNKNVLLYADLAHLEGNEDVASDAGLISAAEEEPGILFQIDELGRFFRTIGDPKKAPHLYNVLTALMKLFSSADTLFRGKAYADRKRCKVIDQPCVSVYGTTVPEHFYESLTAEALQDGLIARWLVFEGEAWVKRQRVPERPVPESILQAARWWADFVPGGNLYQEHPRPLIVPTTAAANRAFDNLADVVDAELARDVTFERSLWARTEEKACRLALVWACSANREKPVIDETAARWACDLSRYVTERMLYRANQWVADGLFDARQKKVLRLIRDAGGEIGHSELYNRTRSLTPRERQEVLENLVQTGQIEQRVTATATKSRTTYVLC